MTEVPTGWIETQISEIVELQENGRPFQQGWSPQCESRPAEDGEWGVVKTTAIQHGAFWSHENKALPLKLDPKPLIEIRQGDVLMTCAGPRNRCGVACLVKATRSKLMMSGKMYRFRPHPDALDPQFLSYFIGEHETQQRIDKMKTGISDSGLNLTHGRFALLPVRLPPLNEQRRIVEKIEAMFEKIDKGIENLRAARTTLALYRQSLLKSAFEGRLTANWRAKNADKLEDPKVLLFRIQKERDARYKVTLDDWQTALTDWRDGGEEGKKPAKPKRQPDLDSNNGLTLGHVIIDVSQGWSPKCKNTPSQGDKIWGVIKTTAIQPARFNDAENKELPDTLGPREHLELAYGDVLITRAGPRKRVGVACMVKQTRPRLMLCDKAYRLTLDEKFISPEFLEGFLNAPHTQDKLEDLKSGISDSGLNLTQDKFMALNLWLPSPAEQGEITGILDARLEAAEAMEAEIDAALRRANALRQSILKRAFAGELVPQDPTDEPASTLLARIKEEQAKAVKPKRKTRGVA
jgi:type I restriction enzyme S subunit